MNIAKTPFKHLRILKNSPIIQQDKKAVYQPYASCRYFGAATRQDLASSACWRASLRNIEGVIPTDFLNAVMNDV